MSADTVFDIGTGVLNAATIALTCTDVAPPDTRMVTLLLPPVDCEMLAVYPIGIAPTEENRAGFCAVVPDITYVVEVWRCVYSGDDEVVPTVEEQMAASLVISRDGWLLWADMTPAAIKAAVDAILLEVGEPAVCYNVNVGQVEFLPTQGNYSGVRFGIRIEADGRGCEV